MSDYSRDRLGPDDEDRLPWLEPVEEEPEEGGLAGSRLVIWLVAAVLVVALVIGAFLWLRDGDKAASGAGALIKAPDAYYKERAAAGPGATADDEIVYSASKGNEVESTIDTSSTAETPVNVDRPPAAAPAAPAPAPTAAKAAPPPAAKPATPSVATPPAATPAAAPTPVKVAAKPAPKKPATPKPEPAAAPAPSSGGSMIQLGAFSTQAKANAAWKNLSGRFSFLAGLTQSVAPVQSGGKTLYRLRASGGGAGDVCARLRTAGESCSVIG